MTVLAAVRTGPLARINPVAKLGASLIIAAVLLLSIDWVSALVALVAELVLLCFARLPLRTLWLRTLPVLIAAPLTGLTTLLYGRTSGTVYWHWLFVEISDGSIALAIATALRVLAIGLPAVLLFLTIDPTDLADGLAQVLHLPARFVLGGLAGLRLVGLFIDDWRALSLARRARGVADRGRIRRLLGQAFALFVLSIRRGSKLATAMEARGFGTEHRRTWARPSAFAGRDWVVLALGAAVGVLAVAVSLYTGDWNFVVRS
ncbi:energy-coupling factor transporter transmembrane component T [Microbacterium sp. STN6]|uniref:energy-coupling factor transporter transmembrane component T family protein n=1 Tax=Microbacterium sp. STN6 TaxID=2995588 RepID=UPI0022608968|nr:energy-coupling factor transporter transmembrane component T [Microbacterium sp. STN6]MCX7522174.1 energy-coupling factor transporter transmembrane component T [Microbacterium sp. STN6]